MSLSADISESGKTAGDDGTVMLRSSGRGLTRIEPCQHYGTIVPSGKGHSAKKSDVDKQYDAVFSLSGTVRYRLLVRYPAVQFWYAFDIPYSGAPT